MAKQHVSFEFDPRRIGDISDLMAADSGNPSFNGAQTGVAAPADAGIIETKASDAPAYASIADLFRVASIVVLASRDFSKDPISNKDIVAALNKLIEHHIREGNLAPDTTFRFKAKEHIMSSVGGSNVYIRNQGSHEIQVKLPDSEQRGKINVIVASNLEDAGLTYCDLDIDPDDTPHARAALLAATGNSGFKPAPA